MRRSKIQYLLFWIWISFFILNLLVLLNLFYMDYIEWIDLKTSLKALNKIFAPYMGLIILYFFAKEGGKITLPRNRYSATIAILGSFIWNLLISSFLLPLLFGRGTLEDSLEMITNVSALFSWLVAGALGYYFAKEKS